MIAPLTQPNLRNIIFDLGDVIIPIDMGAPIRNFATLANLPEETVTALWKQHNLWHHYETGVVDDAGFRQHVRQLLGNADWADDVIDTTWNSILLDLPVARIERILELKATRNYRLFLLSNTNAIHVRQVNQLLVNLNQLTLEALFERVFYSHEVGMAKPLPNIYQHVLTEAGLVADETLFLDDNPANIESALALGIRAVQVVPPLTMLDYLVDV